MKQYKLLSLILMFGLVVLLSACSKKPVMDAESLSPPAMSEVSSEGNPEVNTVATASLSVSRLESVYFDYDSHILSPKDQQTLERNATLLLQESGFAVTIEGHCDERGSDEYNLALGEQRAASVKDYLVTRGVEAARLTAISYGEERPVMAGKDEVAWSKNRRVSFN